MGLGTLLTKLLNRLNTEPLDDYMEVYNQYKLGFVENLSEEDWNSVRLYLLANSKSVMELQRDYAVVEVTRYNLAVILNDTTASNAILNIVLVEKEDTAYNLAKKMQVKLIFEPDYAQASMYGLTDYLERLQIKYHNEKLKGEKYELDLVCTSDELMDILKKCLHTVRVKYIADV